MKKDLVAPALSVFFSCLMITQTYATETAEELYQKGVLLSEQWQPAADKYIKKAADLGNTKAMCLWAEMNKPSMFMHTEESVKYYKKAKKGGDLCGYAALLTSNDVEEAIQGRFSLYVLVNTLIPPDNHDFVSSRRCSFTLNQAK